MQKGLGSTCIHWQGSVIFSTMKFNELKLENIQTGTKAVRDPWIICQASSSMDSRCLKFHRRFDLSLLFLSSGQHDHRTGLFDFLLMPFGSHSAFQSEGGFLERYQEYIGSGDLICE